MTKRVTEGARRERHPCFARFADSPFPRACTALTKSEEKETARSLIHSLLFQPLYNGHFLLSLRWLCKEVQLYRYLYTAMSVILLEALHFQGVYTVLLLVGRRTRPSRSILTLPVAVVRPNRGSPKETSTQ